MAPKVEKLLDGFSLAEGPHWDEKKNCLYFVDMTNNTIHKYIPSSKKHTQVRVDQNVSIIIPVKGRKDEFIVTLNRSIAVIKWDGESEKIESVKQLYEVEEGTPHVFNDGKCDKTGRIWSGTNACVASSLEDLTDKQGTLYSFQNGKTKSYRKEIGISNGIAFDYNINKMYYVDSYRNTIDQYDINFEEGTLSNLTTIFHTEKHGFKKGAIFDGMAIDTEGNLWVATFGASRVYQINPRIPETVLQFVELPAVQITSVAFGGPNLDELYVTSGNVRDAPGSGIPGSLFRVTGINAKGLPADEAVI